MSEAPILSVLLICSQLKAEYLESSVFRTDLTVVVGVSRWPPDQCHGNIEAAMSEDTHAPVPTPTILPILRRAKHIVLPVVTIDAERDVVDDIFELAKMMQDLVPSLESIQVGIEAAPRLLTWVFCRRSQRASLDQQVAQNLETWGFASEILGCHRAQVSVSGRLQLREVENQAAGSDDFMETYLLYKHHLSLFTKSGQLDTDNRWTEQQVVDMFPLPDYYMPRGAAGRWNSEQWMKAEYGGMAKVIRAWYDVTDEELAMMHGG